MAILASSRSLSYRFVNQQNHGVFFAASSKGILLFLQHCLCVKLNQQWHLARTHSVTSSPSILMSVAQIDVKAALPNSIRMVNSLEVLWVSQTSGCTLCRSYSLVSFTLCRWRGTKSMPFLTLHQIQPKLFRHNNSFVKYMQIYKKYKFRIRANQTLAYLSKVYTCM